LIGLIIFFSATQLGLHFWPLSTLVYGIRIDYLAPTIYLLDLLIVGYLIARKCFFTNTTPVNISLIYPILLVNLLYSQNPLATLSWSLHFFLYYLFLISLRSAHKFVIRFALALSLLFESILSLLQIYLGHSLGGLLYYLGERNISVGSPNIALGTFMDHVVLRAYGTLSHPNILAGYAVISFLIILKINKSKILLPLLSTTLLVLLTQSRAAAIALFGIIIPFSLIKNLKLRAAYLIILMIVVFRFGVMTPSRSDLSFVERLNLQQVSLSAIAKYPLFGTGAQSSISTYPSVVPSFRLLQPDHNSFTLFLSWFGIFGVLATLYILRSQFENLRIYDLKFVVPLLPLLLLDHYLLTSPQGVLILLLYFAVAVNYSHVQKNREQHPRPTRR